MGYSIFNDGSIRDYQFKAPQWTPGKNFETPAPSALVLSLPTNCLPAAKGLRLETRLNGQVVQSASISDMVFPVAKLGLDPVAVHDPETRRRDRDRHTVWRWLARKPPLWMKAWRYVRSRDRKDRYVVKPGPRPR